MISGAEILIRVIVELWIKIMEKWKLKAPCLELTLSLEAAYNIKIIVFCLRIRPR